jgi:hypothetical protein
MNEDKFKKGLDILASYLCDEGLKGVSTHYEFIFNLTDEDRDSLTELGFTIHPQNGGYDLIWFQ